MSARMKSPRGPAPRIIVKAGNPKSAPRTQPVPRVFPGPFKQLVGDLAAHRKQKAGPMIVIPVAKQPEQKINTLRQEISRYAKK